MADISAKDVMALRNRTGLAMMECKKALNEAGGDIEAAEELLRKKLKGKMETRVDRAAGEGCIAIASTDNAAAIVELRAETDFTAKNENFTNLAKKLAEMALKSDAGSVAPTDEMTAAVEDLKISTGENLSIARMEKLEGDAFGSYIHHDGKTGVLLQTSAGADEGTLRQVCMHITAAVPRPLGITTDDIPADMVEKERNFRTAQAVESGKPQEIAEKMVEGGMKKFYAEVALLEQPFIMDEKKSIREILGDTTVGAFRRWEVGEG